MRRLFASPIVALIAWIATWECWPAIASEVAKADIGVATAWLQRVETYAAKMNKGAQQPSAIPKDKTDVSTARVILCESYVRLGRIREAEEFVRTAEDGTPEDRASRCIILAMALADAGRIEAAIRWAESLNTNRVPMEGFPGQTSASSRERSLYSISRVQSREHDFLGAEQTIQRIRDPEVLSSAWRQLAERQAKAGQYESAARILAKMIPVSKAGEAAMEETRALIAKCRAEGRREPLPPKPKSQLDVFRNITALFADVTLEGPTLEQQEAKVAGMTNPMNRAAAWRQIAWGRLRTGDRPGCIRAIGKSLESARDIPTELGFHRAANELLLADLYLELGLRSAAIELVRAARDSSTQDQLVQRGLGEFTTRPLAISVFARTGAWEDAVAVARKSEGPMCWQVLGACLGESGEIAQAEQVLRTIQDDWCKAVFCAGVTCGLTNDSRSSVQNDDTKERKPGSKS